MGRQTQYSPTAAVPPAPQRRGGECASLGHPPAGHARRPHIEGLHRITGKVVAAPAQPTVGKGRPRQPLHTAGGRACRVAFTAAARLPVCPRGGQWGGGGAAGAPHPRQWRMEGGKSSGPRPPRRPSAWASRGWNFLAPPSLGGPRRRGTVGNHRLVGGPLPPPPPPQFRCPPRQDPFPVAGSSVVRPEAKFLLVPLTEGLCRPPVGVGRESSSGLGGTNTASALSARGSGEGGGARVWAPAAALQAPPLGRPPPASVSCAPTVTAGASTVGRNERR